MTGRAGVEGIEEETFYCGSCGEETEIAWEYQDTSIGHHAYGYHEETSAEAVSECCRAQLFSDVSLTVEVNPDPNDYGAFDRDFGDDE